MTNQNRVWSIAILLAALTGVSGARRPEGGSISGTVSAFGVRVITPSVVLTTYADKACADLAEKKNRSQAENDQLARCRKENVRTTRGDRAGIFEIRDLPPGWYSLTISWPQGNFSVSCSELAPTGWVIRNVQSGDLILVVATSSPFELKTGDKLEKDLDWCR